MESVLNYSRTATNMLTIWQLRDEANMYIPRLYKFYMNHGGNNRAKNFEDLILTMFRDCGNASDSNKLYRSRKARSPFHPTFALISKERETLNNRKGMFPYLTGPSPDWGRAGNFPTETWKGTAFCWVMEENFWLQNELSKFRTVSPVLVFRRFEVQAYAYWTIKLKWSYGEELTTITVPKWSKLSTIWSRILNFKVLRLCWQCDLNKRQTDVFNFLMYDLMLFTYLVDQHVE